ncbi:MAG: zf-TFIIB domain-containing protein [Trueperaceae bacterium]|nr:zf-TFIIB domain-containing protein [Trueperaceae bacterium]
MGWLKKAELCVGCKEKKTRRILEGKPVCAYCQLKVKAYREGVRNCPVDGTAMEKHAKYDFIIDKCPTCNGVWLDAGEMDIIEGVVIAAVAERSFAAH